MSRENKSSDQDLRERLRGIEVPSDLKARLLALPQTMDLPSSETTETKSVLSPTRSASPSRPMRGYGWGLLVSAATVAALMLSVGETPEADLQDGAGDRVAMTSGNDSTEPREPGREVVRPRDEQGIYEAMREDVELSLTKLEIRQLQRRIRDLRSKKTSSLGGREDASMILALADQAAIEFGASATDVGRDMARIIETYPETRGAEIARQYLASQSN